MPEKFKTNILERSFTSTDLDLFKQWGDYLSSDGQDSKKVTTSQLRKFFGEIKRIQADFDHSKKSIILLDPKIAYAVGRAKKDAGRSGTKLKDFHDLLSPLLNNINEEKGKFKNFVSICESIVAYHKAAGGE
jgi:CRISPR-associated protein Csm2